MDEQDIKANTGGGNSAAGRPSDFGIFSSFRYHNFRLLFTSTMLGNAAQWIQQVTLSWLVYNLTGSGTMLGTINVVRSVAGLSVIPVAGNMIDRVNRRRLLVIINLYLCLITLVVGVLLVTGHTYMWVLLVFAAMGGLAGTFDNNLRQVLIFNIVPRPVTPNAVALIQTGWGLMRSFGPAIGGFLILWFGPGGNFLVQAGAFVLITITVYQISFPVQQSGTAGGSFFQNIREGVSYVTKSPVTRAFTLMGFVLPLLIVPIYTILPPIYAEDVFGGGPDILGYLMSAVGAGGIFGGIVTASLGKVEHRGIVQLVALFLLSMSLVAFAFCTVLWMALIFLGISGFFEMIFITSNQTLLQLSIPDALRGRVTSVVNLNGALSPLGGLIAGVGSDLFGGPKPVTIFLAGSVALIAVLVFVFSSSIRDYRMSKAIAGQEISGPA